MIDYANQLFESHSEIITWIAGISIVTFLVSILLIPWVITRLPPNYFLADYRDALSDDGSLFAKISSLAKNLLGATLVIAGFLMFFIPGQGILTMLIGLGLMNFPGKYALERKLISRPPVFKSVNWIRRKAKVADILHPDHDG